MSKATIIVGHDWTINDLGKNFVKIFEIDKMDDFTLKDCVFETVTEYHEINSISAAMEWDAIIGMGARDLSMYLKEYDMTMMVKVDE